MIIGWRPEQDDELRRLQAKGLTGGQIAYELRHVRPGASRGSVISRLKRLGLSPLGGPIGGKVESRAPREPGFRPKPKPKFNSMMVAASCASIVPLPEPPPSGGVGLFESCDGQCRWPLNHHDPISEFRFCGAGTVGGSSWCADHCRLAYTRLARGEAAE
jgi:hypothetical protein